MRCFSYIVSSQIRATDCRRPFHKVVKRLTWRRWICNDHKFTVESADDRILHVGRRLSKL